MRPGAAHGGQQPQLGEDAQPVQHVRREHVEQLAAGLAARAARDERARRLAPGGSSRPGLANPPAPVPHLGGVDGLPQFEEMGFPY